MKLTHAELTSTIRSLKLYILIIIVFKRHDAAQHSTIIDINMFVFDSFNLEKSIEDVSSFTMMSRYNTVKKHDTIKSNRVSECAQKYNL